MLKRTWVSIVFGIMLLFGVFCSLSVNAQDQNTIVKGKVLSERLDTSFVNSDFINQKLEVEILEGPDSDQIVTINASVRNADSDYKYGEGDSIYLIKGINGDYFFGDRNRLPRIWLIFALFFVVVVALAGKRGLGSIFGLGSSILIIAFYIIPMIIAGNDPFFVSLQGIVVAALVSFYFAHGFNRRTTIALIGTMITLVIAGLLAWFFTRFLFLTGNYSEDTVYLQRGVLENLDLRGLFLGGVMLGTLGVLDDITTAQVAAVEQIKKANYNLKFTELFKRSYSIGKEHIAGLVNTLAFAYIGSSFALILLFSFNNSNPWWYILNSEFIATEIVQSLVGSIALVLAVPITTFLACKIYESLSKEQLAKGSSHEVHTHVH